MTFHVVPIPAEVADFVRAELRSPQYGHPATIETAQGYGPCRQCLRVFRQGEEDRVLFTYNPVPTGVGIPQPGPVFIHKEACQPFGQKGFPPDLEAIPMFLEGFGRGSWLVERAPVDGDVEAAVRRMLANPAIEHLQLRNAEAGCFIAHIEPARELTLRVREIPAPASGS